MEQALQLVVLASLQWVHTQVDICQQRQVLNIAELVDLADVVERNVKEFEALNGFKTLEFGDRVLG